MNITDMKCKIESEKKGKLKNAVEIIVYDAIQKGKEYISIEHIYRMLDVRKIKANDREIIEIVKSFGCSVVKIRKKIYILLEEKDKNTIFRSLKEELISEILKIICPVLGVIMMLSIFLKMVNVISNEAYSITGDIRIVGISVVTVIYLCLSIKRIIDIIKMKDDELKEI
ncbi:MAG: hypothetical protein SOX50_06830 [Terrisporobacter othiniensis]|uniref:hypothetical protein n=1 Tax=Terrisporobacter othiniensis TaxID=1577792 RepID=UPI002A7547DB|nr:hypothetical protein [Terrisporobacter othiniensis]MDY3372973.1 hypothetical protein [Terrisporobacter othiniensis]